MSQGRRRVEASDTGPTPGLPLLAVWFLTFVAVWVGLNRALGHLVGFHAYHDVFTDTRAALVQMAVPMAAAGAVTLWIAARRGLLRELWYEPESTPHAPPWMWTIAMLPVLAVIGLAMYESTAVAHIRVFSWPLVVSLLVATVVAGFAEEVQFRGLLLAGARRRFSAEWQAFALSTALFGALPLFNFLLGAPDWLVLRQCVIAVTIGATLYCVRRLARSLLPAIAFHVLWSLALGLGFS